MNLKISYLSPASLNLNACNPRSHSNKQIRQIAKSIETFGFVIPVIINVSNAIICGHGRVLAAIQLGLAEIPTICLDHLSEVQIKALTIADNKLTENSKWNENLLTDAFKEILALDLNFNIEVTGFSIDQIEIKIENSSASPDDDPQDQIPSLPDKPPISKAGDIWQLGPHRLLCGDATKPNDIAKLMNGKSASMTFTDPPYDVAYEGSKRSNTNHRSILNDDLDEGFEAFLSAACANILSVTDGAIYLCMSSSALHLLHQTFVKNGGHWSTFIIWAKHTFTLGRSDYQRQYEPILYGWRNGAKRHWCDARDQGD